MIIWLAFFICPMVEGKIQNDLNKEINTPGYRITNYTWKYDAILVLLALFIILNINVSLERER